MLPTVGYPLPLQSRQCLTDRPMGQSDLDRPQLEVPPWATLGYVTLTDEAEQEGDFSRMTLVLEEFDHVSFRRLSNHLLSIVVSNRPSELSRAF